MKLRLLLSAAAAFGLSACTITPPVGVTHVVIFRLKNPGSAADRAKLIETSRSFHKIPGVLSVTAGSCIPSPRPVVDSSFDVGVSLTFASVADLQGYQSHPLHKAVSTGVLRDLVKKMTVYDFGYPVPPS